MSSKEVFMNPILLLAAAPALGASPASDEAIIVTAALEPQSQSQSPVTSSLIEAREIESLNLPLAADLLRVVPGVSVSRSGPAGSQTQVRIRGAEASHTLLFVDGIRFNDPAAANEARFELLVSDSLSRIEIVRGPQSALWGSEAIGGVIAVESADARRSTGLSALAEYGSLNSDRIGGQAAHRAGDVALSAYGSWLSSDGIDALGDGAERDAFRNGAAGLKAVYAPSPRLEVGAVGHLTLGRTEFDDFDPRIFRRGNTLHATLNRIAAGRLWAKGHFGRDDRWSLAAGASLLDSSNRNRLAGDPINRTAGRRWVFDARLSRDLGLGGTRHRITMAAEHHDERFHARDQQYSGATNQDRSRNLNALAGEWRAEWSEFLVSDVAVRHDDFSDFPDTTTFRASLLLRPAAQWTIHAAYGEGIAQPSFYDLFGFFPGSFVGNPDLRPETSRNWEAGVRWSNGRTHIGVTGFTGHLDEEIVDLFDPATFLSTTANASGRSRRKGIEAEARQQFGNRGLLALSYTYLDVEQQEDAGTLPLREVRRPRHSGSLTTSWTIGSAEIGVTLAYVGGREDTDFESLPARRVKLGDYLLGSLNFGWQLGGGASAFVRAENLFDADYEDAFGYETSGRTIHAGLRLRLGT
jgi:vitamin B12 transporter